MRLRFLSLLVASFLVVGCGSETEQPPATRTAGVQAGPTATATPDLRPVHVYVAALRPLFADYRGATSQFAHLYGRAANDPQVLSDSAWNEEITGTMTLIQTYGGQLRGLEAPACMAAFHSRLLEAIGFYDEAMEIFAAGLANLNAETRGRGTRLLGDGYALFADLNLMLMSASARCMSDPTGAR